MNVAGYRITKFEEYTSGHFVCLGRMHTSAVTWEATGANHVPDNFFWGHYWAREEEAIVDYHKRLAALYERLT